MPRLIGSPSTGGLAPPGPHRLNIRGFPRRLQTATGAAPYAINQELFAKPDMVRVALLAALAEE